MAKRHPIVHHAIHHVAPIGGGFGIYFIYDSVLETAKELTKDV